MHVKFLQACNVPSVQNPELPSYRREHSPVDFQICGAADVALIEHSCIQLPLCTAGPADPGANSCVQRILKGIQLLFLKSSAGQKDLDVLVDHRWSCINHGVKLTGNGSAMLCCTGSDHIWSTLCKSGLHHRERVLSTQYRKE